MGAVALVGLLPTAALAGDKSPAKDKLSAAEGTKWGDKSSDRVAQDAYGRNEAEKDPGSLFTITSVTGAREVWKARDSKGRAVTGRGVTVAVLDSGVADVPGLDAPGKIVRGPDLSFEADSARPLPPDTYGHGTHMAGIIAAADSVERDGKTGMPKAKDAAEQLGMAPDARLLALKLATADGSTDVSQVVAALDWVVQHRNDNGMNVRVVNLSFGTTSMQPYQLDPLAAAAENAWRHGLVVVVSAGNGGEGSDGSAPYGLTNPAIDPYVLAVGAADGGTDVKGWANPQPASFSSRGTAARPVDLMAPGRSVVALRAPGSAVDVQNPGGRVSGDRSGRLFRGSGTSQAAAVVSGAAALLLQANPELTPDAVKAALVSTAQGDKDLDPLHAGAGQLDVDKAFEAVAKAKQAKNPASTLLGATQRFAPARGTGSLELARGGNHVVSPDGLTVLRGEIDALGQPFDAAAWSTASAAGTAWKDGTWMRARWSGDAWTSQGWARARWSDADWARARWSDADWARARWSDADWARARWSDASWSRARWSDADWSRARWSDASWSRARWSGGTWS